MVRAAALSLFMSCSVTVGALGEATVGRVATTAAVGARVDWQTRRLSESGEGLTLGARLDHLAQVEPGVTYDRSRWELLGGFSVVPRGFRRTVGFDLLLRAGVARGALGGLTSTPLAFSTGLSLALPMRVVVPDLLTARFGDDEVLRWTLMVVPFVDAGFLWSPDLGPQGQFNVGAALRLHFDSALLP